MPTMPLASSRPNGRPRPRWRRPSALLAAVGLLVGVAAACEPADTTPPIWSELDLRAASAVALGPHVVLSWPAAQGAPTRYRVDVGGASVTMPPGAGTSCVLVGLSASTAHQIVISAYDAAGNWSGAPVGPVGRNNPTLTIDHTTPAGPGGGPTRRCVPTTDSDGDRLPDALETATGAYAHTAATGTRPDAADSDDDGLRDGDEVLGAANGLDLLGLGVRPTGKDILLEIDWATTPACAIDMRPRATWVDPIVAAFAGMPVPNVGPSGIKLIVDYGQGGAMTGGNAIPDADGRLQGTGTTDPRPTNFSPQREGYFHYATIGSTVQSDRQFHGGLGEVGGDSLWFGFGCAAHHFNDHSRSFILMHELGHNLTLRHGGHETLNHKPNYGSIMNYRYMVSGADLDCDGWGDGTTVFDFSRSVRGPIDENAIDERVGPCGGPMDIDGDGAIDQQVYAADVNYDGARTVLTGANDMTLMDLAAFAPTTGGTPRAQEEIVADPIDEMGA